MSLENLKDGQFLVTLQAIVYNIKTKKILIGLRKNDPNIEQLSWTFIGGKAKDEDLEESLKNTVKEKTGLDIGIKEMVHAKTYPENRKIISIYFCTESETEQAENKGFKELKWIEPKDIQKYFTTSIHPKVLEFLKRLD
ncbi:MAG: NUDIX domain-containing protein [Nanohaloarchaea archaeon]|nr:NUDIX domain-containing protein [Candidatus Nanohaloarchaea archaeon]